MADSVDVLDVNLDSGSVESKVSTWLSDNSSITSLDEVETLQVGTNRGLVIILYTA